MSFIGFLNRVGIFFKGTYLKFNARYFELYDSNVLYPQVAPTGTPVTKTANYAVTASDFGSIFNNTGDTGAQTLTLPAASTVAGKALKVAVTAAQIINISPAATDAIWLNGSGVDNKDVIIAGVIGNYVDLYSNGTDYIVTAYSGVVTKEA